MPQNKLLPAALAAIALGFILYASLDRPVPSPDELAHSSAPASRQPSPTIAKRTTEAPLEIESEFARKNDKTKAAGSAIAEPGRLLTARGWVRNALGNGIDRVKVEIENHGFDGEDLVTLTTLTGEDGKFEIPGLAAEREYQLNVHPLENYAAYSIESFSVDGSSEPLEIVLNRVVLVNVDGMILDANQAPVANFEMNLRSLTAHYPERIIRSDASGYFRLENFPAGELRIDSTAVDTYLIKGLELKPEAYENLTLVVDRGNYHLSGWVSNSSGVPIANALVTMKSAIKVDDYHSYAYRTSTTDISGSFEFTNLSGQKSTLAVYAKGYNKYVQQHSFQSFSDNVEIRLQH